MLSIHAAADQIVQWWDAYACQQSRRFLKIPLEPRHHMVLLCLEQMGTVKRRGNEDLGEIEYWDLSDRMPVALKGERLSRIRRMIRLPEEIKVTRHQIDVYAETLNRAMLRNKNQRDCRDFASAILISIADGDAELLGWDEQGRMKFSFTAQGSRRTGAYGIYTSAIGSQNL
jgi:hypothetical protein